MKEATTEEITTALGHIAADVAECSSLDARDRNTAIGMLRNAAAFIRGAQGLPGYKQAPFTPTTKPAPTQDSLPDTPPRT